MRNIGLMPWKLLTRGYHQCIYDHDYWKPTTNQAAWDTTRYNIGATVEYAGRMDLARTHPWNDMASTKYCLANPGREYLVFRPGSGPFTVKGLKSGRKYRFEWYEVASHSTRSRGSLVATASDWQFDAPFGDAVLYLVLDE